MSKLSESLNRIMQRDSVTPAEIQKATNVPWATLHDWINGSSERPLLTENIRKVALYLEVSIEELGFNDGRKEKWINELIQENKEMRKKLKEMGVKF